MNKQISKQLKKYKTNFELEYELINSYRIEWGILSDKIIKICELYKNEAKKINLTDNLNLAFGVQKTLNSKNGMILLQEIDNKNSGVITFGFNRYPVGISYTKTLSSGKKKLEEETNYEFESGSKISFTQLPNGAVAVLYFFAKSELMELPDKFFVFKIFDNPIKITDKDIIKCINILFKVQAYSSVISTQKIKLRIYMWLFIRKEWKKYLKKIPSSLPYLSKIVNIDSFKNETVKK